jgi:hypothetical protein
MWDVLYDILIETCMPMKLVIVIEVCKNLSDTFSPQHDLQQRDALLSLAICIMQNGFLLWDCPL